MAQFWGEIKRPNLAISPSFPRLGDGLKVGEKIMFFKINKPE